MIRAIAAHRKEPALFHNHILASECLLEAGENRVSSELSKELNQRMIKALRPTVRFNKKMWTGLAIAFVGTFFGKAGEFVGDVMGRTLLSIGKDEITIYQLQQRIKLCNHLSRLGINNWQLPFGEPEWVPIPAGKFWMGEDGQPHEIQLPEFQISRVPITNAQYALFVEDIKYNTPHGWDEGRQPKGKESHPVVNVTWYDAIQYCKWLSEKSGKRITLLALGLALVATALVVFVALRGPAFHPLGELRPSPAGAGADS